MLSKESSLLPILHLHSSLSKPSSLSSSFSAMDSGNSSSIQSSSGGCGGNQEEYDSHSRADQSISALFNQNNSTTVSSNIAVPTQLDSLIANYFNTSWSTENPLWSTSNTKPNDEPRPQPQISSEPVFFTNPLQQNLITVSNNTNTTSPICSVPTDKKNGLNNMSTRKPKKRSRVSRRAPTTVLTTDTSNFRAMVQEFTGNPSTPFTGISSSPFSRSRFDFFGSSSSTSSSLRTLRPFPQRPTSSPSDYHHQSLLLNMNTQNPVLNNHSPNQALMNHSILSEKSKPLSLGTSNGFGNVEVGTNFEGLQNIIVSSSSSMTQPTLNIIHGEQNSEAENVNHLLRSINGEESMVRRSDATGQENNLAAVRNEGMVELSWISSSD